MIDKDKDKTTGYVSSWRPYKCPSSGNRVYKPEFETEELNPLSDYLKINQRTNKATSKLINLLNTRFFLDLTLTFPSKISERLEDLQDRPYYSYNSCSPSESRTYQDKARELLDKAWNCYQVFFRKLENIYAPKDKKMGSHSNLHLWKTGKPFKPHLHFHNMLPLSFAPYTTSTDPTNFLWMFTDRNYKKIKDQLQRAKDNDNEKKEKSAYLAMNRMLKSRLGIEKFNRYDWFKPFKKPFRKADLQLLWAESIEQVFDITLEVPPVVYMTWVDSYKDRPRMIHKMKYKARTPKLDFLDYYRSNSLGLTEYNNKSFIKFLFEYKNHSRTFGYLNWSKNFLRANKSPYVNLCPFCGAELKPVDDEGSISGYKIIQEARHKFHILEPPSSPEFDIYVKPGRLYNKKQST